MAAERRGRAGTAVPDTATSYTPPPTHFNRKPERKAYPRTTARGGSKERESGTAVPDTAVSYTQSRGPNPRTTACGGWKGRESGHGCTRHRGIIHYTEREGGAGRAQLCQTQPPATHLQRNDGSYLGCCWQGFVREKARLREESPDRARPPGRHVLCIPKITSTRCKCDRLNGQYPSLDRSEREVSTSHVSTNASRTA